MLFPLQIPCQPQKQAFGGIGATADVSKCFRYSYAPLDCSISKRFLHVGIFLLLFPPKPHPNRQSNDRTEPGKAAVRPGRHHQGAAERPAHHQFQDRADERGPGHRAGCRRGEDFQDGGTRTCGRNCRPPPRRKGEHRHGQARLRGACGHKPHRPFRGQDAGGARPGMRHGRGLRTGRKHRLPAPGRRHPARHPNPRVLQQDLRRGAHALGPGKAGRRDHRGNHLRTRGPPLRRRGVRPDPPGSNAHQRKDRRTLPQERLVRQEVRPGRAGGVSQAAGPRTHLGKTAGNPAYGVRAFCGTGAHPLQGKRPGHAQDRPHHLPERPLRRVHPEREGEAGRHRVQGRRTLATRPEGTQARRGRPDGPGTGQPPRNTEGPGEQAAGRPSHTAGQALADTGEIKDGALQALALDSALRIGQRGGHRGRPAKARGVACEPGRRAVPAGIHRRNLHGGRRERTGSEPCAAWRRGLHGHQEPSRLRVQVPHHAHEPDGKCQGPGKHLRRARRVRAGDSPVVPPRHDRDSEDFRGQAHALVDSFAPGNRLFAPETLVVRGQKPRKAAQKCGWRSCKSPGTNVTL